MMVPGDEKVVGDRLYAVLTNPPKAEPAKTEPPAVTVTGQWDLHVTFVRGAADQVLILEQQGDRLVGTHRGEFLTGDLNGQVSGNRVRFRSSQKIEGTRLGYDFTGSVTGESMEGVVQMGEYGEARWTAKRHEYRLPGGVVRPVKGV
jgi:L-seryl-tRNA(Ser) seleniumtransferase